MKDYKRTTQSKTKIKKICNQLEKKFDEKLSRTLHGLQSVYQDHREVQRILKKENPLVYEIFIAKRGNIKYGLTIINPGKVGKEYHMTHGYKNKKPYTERCRLIEGQGKLILQGKTQKVVNLQPHKPVTIPKNHAHRIVNTGSSKLKVLRTSRYDSDHLAIGEFKKKVFIEE